jgi:hypothetical protein
MPQCECGTHWQDARATHVRDPDFPEYPMLVCLACACPIKRPADQRARTEAWEREHRVEFDGEPPGGVECLACGHKFWSSDFECKCGDHRGRALTIWQMTLCTSATRLDDVATRFFAGDEAARQELKPALAEWLSARRMR